MMPLELMLVIDVLDSHRNGVGFARGYLRLHRLLIASDLQPDSNVFVMI